MTIDTTAGATCTDPLQVGEDHFADASKMVADHVAQPLTMAAPGMPVEQIAESANTPTSAADLYYLQDSRSYACEAVIWWRRGGCGYTTDLSDAQVYSREDAIRQALRRPTDVPWLKADIDAIARPVADMQLLKRCTGLGGLS